MSAVNSPTHSSYSENSSASSSPRSLPGSNNSSPQKLSPTSPGLATPLSCLSLLTQEPAVMPAARRKLGFEVTVLHTVSQNIIDPLLQLQATAEKITSLTQPLLPKDGDHANDVYLLPPPSPRGKTNPHAVFKPGAENAERAILCHELAKSLGLEQCVPLAIHAEASSAYCKEDFTEDRELKDYQIKTIRGEKWLVDPEDCYFIEESGDDTVTLDDGSIFTFVEQGEGFYLDPKDDELATEHELANEVVRMTDDGLYLVRCEDWVRVNSDDTGLHVIRGGRRSDLTLSQKEAHLSRESSSDGEVYETQSASFHSDEEDDPEGAMNSSEEVVNLQGPVNLVSMRVKGVLMQMVPDVVTQVNGRAVDIECATVERKIFFDMIDTFSFINSIVLACLYRTQDGKARTLDETNFLFSQNGQKLFLTLIDPDETWPTGNDLSEDPELKAKGPIAALRLGLMGYPHAHAVLEAEFKEHFCDLLKQIKQRRRELVGTLERHQQNDPLHLGRPDIKEQIKAAFIEILDRFDAFYDTQTEGDFTLADFVFFAFPTYKEQWDQLTAAGFQKEEISSYIGNRTVEEVISERKAKCERNKSRLNK